MNTHVKARWPAIRQSVVAALALALVLSTGPGAVAAERPLVTYIVHGKSDGLTTLVPVTFGAAFAKGDVPPGTSVAATDGKGNPLPMQVDIKAKHTDGSLRHAVLTVTLPRLGDGDDVSVNIARGPKTQTAPLPLSALPANFDAVLTLKLKDGRQLHASARELLAKPNPELWLSGTEATEWWVSGPLRDASGKADPYLSARFGIRSYGPGRPVRVEVDVENCWVMVKGPRTMFYDASISANGKTVFSQAEMKQPSYTRWRQVFWWDTPVTAYVEQNLDYLKKTRIIPNYVPEEPVSEIDVAKDYKRFSAKSAPLEEGIITAYMPTTGGRGDIGPLPSWTVDYLLTMDKRAYDVTMGSGDLAGSFAAHFRNPRTDRPATSEEFPKLTTHSNFVGKPGNLELPDTGGFKSKLVPQRAHEPSLAFIPYVVTGDRYYLEELQFWSQWNAWGTDPSNRGFQKGLYSWDEIRGQGWSLRTLAQAAYITPENDPLKQVLLRELKANIENYNAIYVNNPHANPLHAAFVNTGGAGAGEFSPWMDDFLTWAAGYTVQLGFERARPFAEWKANFPVQRMINKDYCWILATTYRIEMRNADDTTVRGWKDAYRLTFNRFAKKKVDPDSVACGSEEMADAMGLSVGEMAGGAMAKGGYPANMQPALATAINLGVPSAEEAWAKFQARPRSKKPLYSSWSILPWPKQ